MFVSIYGLVDPRTNELRYVGKTKRKLAQRLRQHINRSRNEPDRNHVYSWVTSLLNDDCKPDIFEIEVVAEKDWSEAEKFWIAYWRSLGANLTNMTEGGGSRGGYRTSEETKAYLSELAKKQFSDPDAREVSRQAAKAQWKDRDMRKSLLKSIRERGSDPEWRKKVSESRKRQWAEDEGYRERYKAGQAKVDRSAIAKDFWQRPEYRQRQAEAQKKRWERYYENKK